MTDYEFIQRIAVEAGQILLKHYGSATLERTIKSHENDFATQADLESEAYIKDQIRQRYPNDAILGEETGFEGSADAEYTWIIDPLDGTYNFANNIPDFGPMIARAKESEIELAAIAFPVRNLLLHAQRGNGTFIGTKRCAAPRQMTLEQGAYCVGTPMLQVPGQEAQLRLKAYLEEKNLETTSFFSSAANALAMVEGRRDAFVLNKNFEWDNAPIDLILREAGFVMTDWEGRQYDWKKGPQPFVVANPSIHAELLGILQRR